MIVYMLRNDDTGKWYRRAPGIEGNWTTPERATSWPDLRGPGGAKGNIKRYHARRRRVVPNMTIVEFELVATGVEKR